MRSCALFRSHFGIPRLNDGMTRLTCYTPHLRRLIINADDFGLTAGVNRGILHSHQHGVVTSTTLMACGDRFEEAAALVKNAPELSVGCHVVLVDGTPALNAAQVSSLLLSPSTPRFRESLVNFAYMAMAGRLDTAQIEAEVTAQVTKLQSAGIQVSHLDSHKHTHMFPSVLKAVLRAAKNCGIHAMRNPFEPLLFASWGNWKRQFQVKLLRSFRARFGEILAKAGVSTPDGCIGIATTGGLTLQTFRMLMENLPPGTWEFVSHPGYNDADLDRIKTRLRDSRDNEVAILTSPAVRELIQRQGIALVSYREL
jgi:hopanoid biosynthesis associated protein HpnK